MATNHKSVRKLSTTVKFTVRSTSTAPARRSARRAFCVSCQMGQHCGQCVCCRNHSPQPRFVNGKLEIF